MSKGGGWSRHTVKKILRRPARFSVTRFSKGEADRVEEEIVEYHPSEMARLPKRELTRGQRGKKKKKHKGDEKRRGNYGG